MEITMNNEQEIIQQAILGDQDAITALLISIQDLTFNLALRMLGDVEDAKDACQEIYIRVLKGLTTFRYESKFSTWSYRIAMNYLLREREKQSRYAMINFEIYAQDNIPANLDVPYSLDEHTNEDDMAMELKASCSNVILQCLDARDRAIYILGTMFQVSSKLGAEIMDITPENYRQILSRVKQKMKEFLSQYCCIEGNCSCKRRIGHALRTHRLHPDHVSYLTLPQLSKERIWSHVSYMQHLEDTSDFFSTLPKYDSTNLLQDVLQKIKDNEKNEHYQYDAVSR